MTEARNERLKVLIEAKNEAAREMPVDWLTAAKMPTVGVDWLTAAGLPTVDIDRLTAGLTIGQAAAMGLQSAEWQALAAKVEASINPAQFLHKDLSNLAGQAFAPLTSRIREDLSQTFAHLTSFSTEQLGLVGSAMMQQAIRQAAEIRIENFGAYADLWPERLIKPAPLLPWPAERPEPGQVQTVQEAEPEILTQLEDMLHQGRADPIEAARVLSKFLAKRPGPKPDNKDGWTESLVLQMWLDWQAYKGNGEYFAQDRWNIHKRTMYKLFHKFDLPASKRGH